MPYECKYTIMRYKNLSTPLLITALLFIIGCAPRAKETDEKEKEETVYPSDVIPFFNHWNLILGDGSNAKQAIDYAHEDFFYIKKDGDAHWVVLRK